MQIQDVFEVLNHLRIQILLKGMKEQVFLLVLLNQEWQGRFAEAQVLVHVVLREKGFQQKAMEMVLQQVFREMPLLLVLFLILHVDDVHLV